MPQLFLALLLALCTLPLHASEKTPTFDESMKESCAYSPTFSRRSPKWRRLHTMYENYLQRPLSSTPLIPHTIHFIWLGSALPARCEAFIATWRLLHPDWTICVWRDQDVDAFQMHNRAAFDAAKNYGEKSDIWRYEILDRFGGVYVDTDFECLKRFDDIHARCTFYTGVAYDRKAILYNGLIGAAPSHPIMKACIQAIRVGPGNNIPHEIMARTGPYFFTRHFFKNIRACSDTTVVFPVSYFYAFPGHLRKKFKRAEQIKRRWRQPESRALHYWGCSWVPPKKMRF